MTSNPDTEISWATSPPEILREHHLADAIGQEGPLPEGVEITELEAEGAFRGGLLFTPPDAVAGKAIVYCHGGGFLAGSPRTHRSLTAWLAYFAGMPVLSARYRLAPEHPFPAQREDAVAACEKAAALFRRPDGFDLFLAGDSAGASVVLWGLLGLAAELRPTVAGVALFYGGFGLTQSASIARAGTAENGLDGAALRAMYGNLLDGKAFTRIEQISVLGMTAAIKEPTYIVAAGEDAIFDDSLALHRALETGGSPTQFVEVPGVDHGYLKQAGALPAAADTLRDVARWLRGLNTRDAVP
jgi:acetyl esterase